jgi:hypothetical protein
MLFFGGSGWRVGCEESREELRINALLGAQPTVAGLIARVERCATSDCPAVADLARRGASAIPELRHQRVNPVAPSGRGSSRGELLVVALGRMEGGISCPLLAEILERATPSLQSRAIEGLSACGCSARRSLPC